MKPQPNMTGISVVIPTLGRPELSRAVESVLLQTEKPREIVVVNNSVRGSLERQLPIGSNTPCKVRVLSLPPFSGPAICRNVGAWEATSRFIAFLDDDDAFDELYLERMLESANGSPETILYGTKAKVSPTGSIRGYKRIGRVPRDRWLQVLCMHHNPGFGGQNLFLPRSLFLELGGFPVSLPTAEDRAFAIRAIRSPYRVVHVDSAVVYVYEPTGYRARRDPAWWLSAVAIMAENWDVMTWKTRLQAFRKPVKRFMTSRKWSDVKKQASVKDDFD